MVDPRNPSYAARYAPYGGGADPAGFNEKQFNSNAVVRWEYRPASTLFLVWQQGRSLYDPTASDFSFPQDVTRVFDVHPMNTLLVKASFWFNP
mgnify:CR=1 FL=1